MDDTSQQKMPHAFMHVYINTEIIPKKQKDTQYVQ